MSIKKAARSAGIRSEGEDKGEPKAEGDEPEPVGRVSSKCGACSLNNEQDAKFCKGCGSSMAVRAEEAPADDEADDEEPAPAAKPGAKAAAPKRTPVQARSCASIAEA